MGYVYFAVTCDGELLKVGYSRQFPETRLAKHQAKVKRPMRMLGVIPSTITTEAQAVRALRKITTRVPGTREWFIATPLSIIFAYSVLHNHS